MNLQTLSALAHALNKQSTAKTLVLSVMVFFSVILLSHTCYIRSENGDTLSVFWIPAIGMGITSLLAAVYFNSVFPMFVILIFSGTFHVMQSVRQPSNLLWTNDAIYVLQLVDSIVRYNHLIFGSGTGMTPFYSYYPIFYLSQSIISIITSWSTITIVKYSMSILNLLTLITFFLLCHKLFDLDYLSTNLIIWMYSLNPMFHSFNSSPHAESFAVIFYPLILMYSLRSLKARTVGDSKEIRADCILMIILLLTVSMSHHYTSYMVVLSLMLPTFLLHWIPWKLSKSPRFLVLSTVLTLVWLNLIATLLFWAHIRSLSEILQSLVQIHYVGSYSPVASLLSQEYYPSELARVLTQVRNLGLLVLALMGFTTCISKKTALYTFFGTLLLVMSSLNFVFLFVINWGGTPLATIRTRVVEFSYFPMAFFAGIAVYHILQKIKSREISTIRRMLTILLVVGIGCTFTITMVFNSFARYIYDSSYASPISSSVNVASEEQYSMSLWLRSYLPDSKEIVFTGSESTQRFVIGYGLFSGRWGDEFFDPRFIERARPNTELFYAVNQWQLTLPDSDGKLLTPTYFEYLNAKFDNVYHNGVVSVYHKLKRS